MEYQVIARKWRPKTFQDLVGQDHVGQTLLNALKNNRLHPVLLFTGQRGTGKTSTARIVAKSLRCLNAVDFVPCNICSDCEGIASGFSLDVMEIDGASNNGVEAVRELRDSIAYMPSSGKFKVYIIDEVHMLSGSAFNALLKTLEEPPDHVKFILATTEVHKIPNTILSRSQRFDFRRISTRKICDHLEKICREDQVAFEPEALWAIARQGDGSMRDSQSLLDQVITFSSKSITLQKTNEALGLTDRQLLCNALAAVVGHDAEKALQLIKDLLQSGTEPQLFVRDLLEEVRHLLMVKLSPKKSKELVDLPDSEIAFLNELALQLSSENIHLLFDMTLKGAQDVARTQEPRLALEMLLLRMVNAPRIENLLAMSGPAAVGMGNASGVTSAAPAAPIVSAPVVPAAPKNFAPVNHAPVNYAATIAASAPVQPTPAPVPQSPAADSISTKWADLVQRIKGVNNVIAANLEHSLLKSIDDETMVITIPARMKFLQDQISDADFQRKLGNYINTFWGRRYNVKFETETSSNKNSSGAQTQKAQTPQALEAKKTQEKEQLVREQIENHPLVKNTQKYFKTKINEIVSETKETR